MPALYSIQEDNNKSEEVADFLLFMLNEDRIPVPKLSIPQLLLAKTRPGMMPDQISSRIISRFPEIGIPNGPLNEGSNNVMESFVRVVIEEVVDAIQNDMRVDIAVDAGITGLGIGGNAGGAVQTFNTSTRPHTGIGVAR